MNRNVLFGSMLFSLAMIMLGFQTEGESIKWYFNMSIPSVDVYRFIGVGSVILFLFFMVSTVSKKWSKWMEKQLEKPWVYLPWCLIFWLVYIFSCLKGLLSVYEANPPLWIVSGVGIIGMVIMVYIPFVVIKYHPKS
jgi:hypothetical protein